MLQDTIGAIFFRGTQPPFEDRRRPFRASDTSTPESSLDA